MLRRFLEWFRCKFRDLHTYALETACDECKKEAPSIPAMGMRCPDCGQKAVFTKTACCKREMWVHAN
jgi:predicted amidophosphoribosyltransferase